MTVRICEFDTETKKPVGPTFNDVKVGQAFMIKHEYIVYGRKDDVVYLCIRHQKDIASRGVMRIGAKVGSEALKSLSMTVIHVQTKPTQVEVIYPDFCFSLGKGVTE